jgi:predicted transcriptional regulator
MLDLLTPSQAAKELQVTEAALSRFRHERRGPAFSKIGKLIRYSRTDLATWIESRKITAECKLAPAMNNQ